MGNGKVETKTHNALIAPEDPKRRKRRWRRKRRRQTGGGNAQWRKKGQTQEPPESWLVQSVQFALKRLPEGFACTCTMVVLFLYGGNTFHQRAKITSTREAEHRAALVVRRWWRSRQRRF